MKRLTLAAALLAPALLAGCVAPVGPVEVTRFHAPDTSRLGKGAIAVEAAPGNDPASLEWRSYQGAVQRQLALLGYTEAELKQLTADLTEGKTEPTPVLVQFERREQQLVTVVEIVGRIAILELNVFEHLARTPGALDSCTLRQGFDAHAHNRSAFSGLMMLKALDNHKVAIDLQRHTALDVVRIYHAD